MPRPPGSLPGALSLGQMTLYLHSRTLVGSLLSWGLNCPSLCLDCELCKGQDNFGLMLAFPAPGTGL